MLNQHLNFNLPQSSSSRQVSLPQTWCSNPLTTSWGFLNHSQSNRQTALTSAPLWNFGHKKHASDDIPKIQVHMIPQPQNKTPPSDPSNWSNLSLTTALTSTANITYDVNTSCTLGFSNHVWLARSSLVQYQALFITRVCRASAEGNNNVQGLAVWIRHVAETTMKHRSAMVAGGAALCRSSKGFKPFFLSMPILQKTDTSPFCNLLSKDWWGHGPLPFFQARLSHHLYLKKHTRDFLFSATKG